MYYNHVRKKSDLMRERPLFILRSQGQISRSQILKIEQICAEKMFSNAFNYLLHIGYMTDNPYYFISGHFSQGQGKMHFHLKLQFMSKVLGFNRKSISVKKGSVFRFFFKNQFLNKFMHFISKLCTLKLKKKK